ncbi:hypothetical protein SAMN05444266_109136 [Chitinophaga jiangningensis]|uniref:Uncharacterized protein n=1 Tax=Chitinophaga jiangningensis TaxID=1419482 RepID=A0A1M7K3B3_9BACT|nr:hypothetical protein [Chitinophaga jiangningensis]SHM59812.1 hypothetical protein SAMN05444266_109136 [Chitinophaga jiangningensis]
MKNTRRSNLLPGIVCLLLLCGAAACSKNDDPVTPAPDVNALYANSIKDAMTADSSEIIDTLWTITPTNTRLQWKTINGKQYVLMATFMRFPSSYPLGDSITTTWGESFLFAPGQMKAKLASMSAGTDTILRICQVLGLPPINPKTNTHIAQMWVQAAQLYRPAGNPDITTTTTGAVLVPAATNDYITWFNNYILFAYFHTLTSATDYHYPWTRLGYTYDWAPGAKEVGMSEFVMKPNSGAWVEKTTTAQDFFKQ